MTWHAQARYGFGELSEEATDNAQEVAFMMITQYGWTLEAAAGAIGNMQYEVGLNPWRWQADNILSRSAAQTSGSSHGYGLIGWTPARKYQFNNATYEYQGHTYIYFPNYDQESYPGYGPNWSDVPGNPNDGAAQTKLICEAMAQGSGSLYYQRSGHVSAATYITLTDVNRAASEWWWCVEYSASQSSIPERQRMARDIYQWLIDHGYTPSGSGKFWYLFKMSNRLKGFL